MRNRWNNQQAALARLAEARRRAHPDRPTGRPVGPRRRRFDVDAEQAPPEQDVLGVDTRQILARAQTGVASRRSADLLAPFQWQEVVSSRVSRVGYNADLQELRVVWQNRPNETWAYFDVPPQVQQLFVTSESPGRFVNSTLNFFNYARIA